MLVHEVSTNLSHLRPQVLKLLTLRVRTARAHNLDIRIFLSHLLHERLQVFRINLAPLLVADTHILQVERSWMTHVGTQFCPHVLGWVTIGKLNQVEHIVDVGLQLIHRHMGIATIAAILELAGETHTHHRQGFCTNLLRQLEILEEAQSVALEIVGEVAMGESVVPTVLVQRTVLHRTHRVLPLIAGGKVRTLHDATAREAEHTRMQLLEALRQVLTHTVLMTLVSINREEAHVLHIRRHLAVAPHTQMRLGKGSVGLEDRRIFLPFSAAHLHTAIAQLLVIAHRGIIHQVNPQFGSTAIGHTSPHREAVLFTALHAHAEEAMILNHRVLVAVSRRSQPHIVRILVERAIILQRHLARDVPTSKVVRELKRAVLHQFAIQTAISGIVDVLEEDAIHRRWDRSAHLGCVDVHRVRLRRHARRNHHCRKNRKDFLHKLVNYLDV